MLSKTVSQPTSNRLPNHSSKGQHCIGEEALGSEQKLTIIKSQKNSREQFWTCKNNAHSKRADAQLLGKDGEEGGDRGRSREEEKEVALWWLYPKLISLKGCVFCRFATFTGRSSRFIPNFIFLKSLSFHIKTSDLKGRTFLSKIHEQLFQYSKMFSQQINATLTT